MGILARDPRRLDEAAENLRRSSGPIEAVSCDVRDADATRGAVTELARRFGGLQRVYACAGTIDRNGSDAPFDRSVVETNLFGAVHTMEAWLETGPQAGSRAAIVASFSAFRGLPHIPAYGASKAAVALYAESLRGRLRPRNLRVTTVFLGYLDSELAGRPRSSFLVTPCSRAAKATVRAVDRGSSSLSYPVRVRVLVTATRFLPDALYDRLVDAKRRAGKS